MTNSIKGSGEVGQRAASSTAAPSSLKSAQHTSKATASESGSSTSDGTVSSTASSDPAILTATPIANSSLVLPSATTQTAMEGLPVTPTITPALSVAGAFLMLTGLFYTLVGIKTKWLHIFLSTAYLTSLATTVLIVYVMHPPVSNAVQGAYFVAAFVTGIIFGGGSVIFTDVTEGLGCLLGGYCLAMWFLVLTPGGLIKSTAGKAIFIACFTLGAFGFYVSHWTRAYGLIGAVSFAGATVIVLGIDCFSRAGLKEFWLYIWDLNENVFPLHYRGPYPITRGIRVEIAAIIIIFLIGVMSQMKIWKIIKRRREERAAEHSKREQLQEQAEEDRGRKIEAGNDRDRNLWEATYGRKKGTDRHIDSGIGTEAPSIGKASLSMFGTNEISSSRPESIEMNDLERGIRLTELDSPSGSNGKSKARANVTVRVASDDDVVQSISPLASTNDGADTINHALDAHSPRAKKKKGSTSPGVVPLPFRVPESDLNGDERSSIAASIASEHFSTRVMKRLPGGSLKRTSSKKSHRSYIATSTSEEALMIPYNDEDDRTSSVGAAVDEVSDGNRSEADGTTLTGIPSPAADKMLKFSPPTEPHPIERPGRKISKLSLLDQTSSYAGHAQEEATAEGQARNPEAVPDHALPDLGQSLQVEASDSKVGTGQPLEIRTADTTAEPERTPEKPALRDGLANLNGASRVVMAYRTNEWAKHLDRAEKPSLDDLRSIRQESSTKEKAAPLDPTTLQQTPLNAEPPPSTSLTKLNTSPHISRSTSSKSQDSLSTTSPIQKRTPSETSLDSLPSQRGNKQTSRRISTSQQPPHRTSRHASTPITNTPIDEDIPSTTFPTRSNLNHEPPLPTSNTLMSRRESMLQTRPSSTSLTRGSYTPLRRATPSNTLDATDDNITLSHRRASLKQQNHSPSSQTPQSSAYPYPTTHQPSPAPYPSQPNQHPPPPMQSASPSPLNLRTHHPRASAYLTDLLLQKRRSETQVQQSATAHRNTEREMDARWRQSGAGMEEKHREAMRRMQNQVSHPPGL